MGKVHELKCWPEQFAAVVDGSKTFEVREDDRGYAVGDHLLLREWSQEAHAYTGRSTLVEVTYRLAGGAFGLSATTCVMAVRVLVGPRDSSEPELRSKRMLLDVERRLGSAPRPYPYEVVARELLSMTEVVRQAFVDYRELLTKYRSFVADVQVLRAKFFGRPEVHDALDACLTRLWR